MRLIETHRLWGSGIGWTDAHLLASALISNSQFWTLDARLLRAAAAAGVRRFPAVKP
jgi:predicted nucleic acid-binding protein